MNLTIYLKLLISFSFISSLFFSKAKANIQLHNTYFKKCLLKYNQAKYELALKDCDTAIEKKTNDSLYYANKANAIYELGDEEGSRNYYKKSAKLGHEINAEWLN